VSPSTFTGNAVAPLLQQARRALGPDAHILRVDRRAGQYVLVAAAPPAGPAAPDFRETLGETLRAGAGHDPVPVRRGDRPLVVALLGPTGSGKTTTVAKLASSRLAFGGRSVGVIGLDTYRVGAVEQLATWTELAGVPLQVVWNPLDAPAALKRLSHCDTVLIDTPGRGPAHAADIARVQHALTALAPDETHLLLPAGTLWRVLRRTVDDFAPLGITHLLATKTDECPDDWGVFELALARRLKMRWLTDGHGVPSDLRFAADRMAGAALRRPDARRVAEVA
jgi:flagellar biosynthesis protein FlhF